MGTEVLTGPADPVPQTATVMVVDDDEVGREMLGTVLRLEGFRVEEATDGREALERLGAGEQPNLILLDMMMPGLDGWQFLAALRRDKRLARVPVIIVTAIGVSSPAWARSLGAVACFRKPAPIDALLAEVRRWCA